MSTNIQAGQVGYHVENGMGTISFYHPAHNSMPSPLLHILTQTIEQAGADPAARVIVLKSAGDRTFCAGASFDELAAIEDFDAGKRFFTGFAKVINALRKCSKLVIGRVQGKAVGGGVGIAAACDYCLATQHADIKLSELAVGIGPFVVGPAVERKIGLSAFSQLAINATEWHSANWAMERGLYANVYSNIADMDAAILELAQKLAQSSPEAMHELKTIFWQGTQHWDQFLEERAAISGRLVLSEYSKKAIKKNG
ncbi:enoyl-CoA hydratase/isomerase family protein [Haliscomenobacter hydrossis]|uniref:Enoyl-CoA hydratase/isomerase n=1 Tax=Haliscomenobacter hydrossis (strain ATCC 27775 / DSM 1100 / LMG 10767 / O) TaxID=760192 RepID=F4L4G9_HALH1|nr:enoyl-CoA hydratase/isomerase family protein [Haliscomenobacter hydrossis]AEE51970.1 Enoyl-CoA hydratase/isomerase [Haliscomenobacter hydrossis DSM 1100]